MGKEVIFLLFAVSDTIVDLPIFLANPLHFIREREREKMLKSALLQFKAKLILSLERVYITKKWPVEILASPWQIQLRFF